MTEVFTASTAAALEYPLLLELMAGLTVTDVGRQTVERMEPALEESDLRSRRARYREAEDLLGDSSLIGFHEESLQDAVDLVGNRPEACSGLHLLVLADLIKLVGRARQRVLSAPDRYPELSQWLQRVPDLDALSSKITSALDQRGEVRDQATPLLARLRRSTREERTALYSDLESAVAENRNHFSEDTISLEGERLVLLLQAGSRDKVEGLVHGKSGTGKSFYFEPLEVVERNNRLREMSAETEAEKRRILNEILTLATNELPALNSSLEFVAELDYLQALHRFAKLSDSRLAEIGDRHDLKMVEARHPLLDPRLADLRKDILGQAGHRDSIEALDLKFSKDERVLVISGPNAGGKTVALKTVGLLGLLSQCGVPIPVGAGTTIPFFDRFEASVGDEQDLLQDRSTFSGRLSNLKNCWEASPDGLVLIDELGSGTDPEEGAALAVALLEGLLAKGPLVVMTTHLTQLGAAAAENDGAVCAAMQFDSDSGLPTYRLELGSPGGSQALALARRLELPAAWLDRAEEIMGPGHRKLRQLLRAVEETKLALGAEKSALECEARRAVQAREELDQERASLAAERKSLALKARSNMEELRRKTRDRLGSEIDRLRAESGPARKARVISKSMSAVFEGTPKTEVSDDSLHEQVVIGSKVRHRTLRWEGLVKKLATNRVEVSVRGKRIRCELADIEPVAGHSTRGEEKSQKRQGKVLLPDRDDAGMELKLIGWRVEEALEELERHIDQALLADCDRFRVVHGHGTGALRDAVRRALKSHPAVAEVRAGKSNEGGDGATVVQLKG